MARALLILLLHLGTAISQAVPPGNLTPIARIRSLTPEQTGSRPVMVEGITTFYDPEVALFFIQDDSGSIFVEIDEALRPAIPPNPGDRVRLTGKIMPGNFLPQIGLDKLEILGSGPVPMPRIVSVSELMQPAADCEWVEFGAVLQGTTLDRFGGLFFDLTADGYPLSAHVSRGEKFATPPWDLLQRKVRIRCVVSTTFNQERQMCGRRLFIPRLSDIQVEGPVLTEGGIPLRLTSEMLIVTASTAQMIRLEGTVTMVDPGVGLIVRDQAGSALVRTAQPLEVSAGDRVEARGFPSMAAFRPNLQATVVRRLADGKPAAPVPFSPKAPLPSRFQHELVTLDVTVIDVTRTRDGTALLCATGSGDRFEARLAGNLPDHISPAARARLTGICGLIDPGPRARSSDAQSWQLALRSPEDAMVLKAAPWLTARRAAWLLGGFAAAAGLIGLWVLILRRQVRAQSDLIRHQTFREATLEERQRIARELHDTLEQDLMGLTLLLDGTAQHLKNEPPAATEQLTLARKLLRRSREESHSTIRDLRSVALDQLGLSGAMEELLQPIAAAASLEFHLEVSGHVRRLPAVVEHHLLRIAHEGVSNAVKHARATRLAILLDYAGESLRLTIRDNGHGGAISESNHHSPGFGLHTLRERANKLGAALEFSSPAGEGTRISLTVPLASYQSVLP